MIDYSVYLTGNPLDEMAPEKAYARAQMSESMTFDKFVKHIADHNGVRSQHQEHQRGVHSRSGLRRLAGESEVQPRSQPHGTGSHAESRERGAEHRRP